LARSLGDKVATPRPGLSEHAIAVARSWASSHGYQPPAMYDEGDPTPAVPSRQIKADLRGEKRLDMAYTVLTARRDGIALPSIAPRGTKPEAWERAGDLLLKDMLCGNSHPDGPARRDYVI